MSFDFLWQEALIFGGGVTVARTKQLLKDRLLHRRLGRFFGGHIVSVAVPTLDPLTTDNFEAFGERTIALKPTPTGEDGQVPVHSVMLSLDDYRASQAISELFRSHGGHVSHVLADVDVLGSWNSLRNVVCIGAPRVNAALAEAIVADVGDTGPLVSYTHPSDELGSARLIIAAPTPLTLGVDATHALGIITRHPNPADARSCVVGVWGCRSQSTLSAAHYLLTNFKSVMPWTRSNQPLVILLAVRGSTFGLIDPIYAGTDSTVLFDRPKLLRRYTRIHEGSPDRRVYPTRLSERCDAAEERPWP